MDYTKIILSVFFVFVCTNTKAQEIFEKKFSPQQLQEDFDILIQAVEEAHPHLFLYQNPKNWQQEIQQYQEKIQDELSEAEFYVGLRELLAKVGDGNTSLMLSQYSDMAMKEYVKFLPMDLYFDDNKIFVEQDYSEEKLPKGTQIHYINEESSSTLLGKSLARCSADGYIKTSSFWRLEQDIFVQELVFLLGSQQEYKITYSLPNEEKLYTKDFRAISYRKKIEQQAQKTPLIDTEKPFSLKIKDGVAYLRYDVLGDFFESSKENFSKFTKKAFEQIQEKKIEKLILDLRNNGAGEELNAKMIYAYLADSNFYYYKRQYIRQQKYSFAKYTDDKFLNRIISPLRKKLDENSNYLISLDGLDKKQATERMAFKGKLMVLVNGGTFGAASELAALIKYNKRGTIIGQETGSSNPAAGAIIPYLILPNTGFQVALPLVGSELAVPFEQTGRGVLPHFYIKNHEKEAFLDKAQELLDQN